MPLVIPGLQSNSGDKTTKWQNDLMGKKLGDSSDQVVSGRPPSNQMNRHRKTQMEVLTEQPKQTFAKKDLPQSHRVVKEGDMTTMDHNPDR